jgi:FKBP12-rapamycin complex-associated protein
MRALSAKCSSRIASITSGSTSDNAAAAALFEQVDKSVRQRGLLSMIDGDSTATASEEALNERALKVIRRVQDKLNGRDFLSPEEDQHAIAGESPLDVQEQVQRLIVQATSSENLSQLFVGWCAFW